MLTIITLYAALMFCAVAALSTMILRIGDLMGSCPQSKAVARAGAVTIATGYAAIGAGGVILIGAALPLFAEAPLASFLLGSGLGVLCLGLGFTSAIATLRDTILMNQRQGPLQTAA